MASDCWRSGAIGDVNRRISTQGVVQYGVVSKEASMFMVVLQYMRGRAAEDRRRLEERGERDGQGYDCT